jgi:hypothetical protein
VVPVETEKAVEVSQVRPPLFIPVAERRVHGQVNLLQQTYRFDGRCANDDLGGQVLDKAIVSAVVAKIKELEQAVAGRLWPVGVDDAVKVLEDVAPDVLEVSLAA